MIIFIFPEAYFLAQGLSNCFAVSIKKKKRPTFAHCHQQIEFASLILYFTRLSSRFQESGYSQFTHTHTHKKTQSLCGINYVMRAENKTESTKKKKNSENRDIRSPNRSDQLVLSRRMLSSSSLPANRRATFS